MAARLSGQEVKLPVLERGSLEQLEALFPARCLDRDQTVEDHLRYAGKVELIAALRGRFEDKSGDDFEAELEGAELASQ